MKARVKATGKIVEVELNHIGCTPIYIDKDGVIYKGLHDLDFEVAEEYLPEDEPDYWEKLKHQYAGMAMQGILSSDKILGILGIQKGKELDAMISDMSVKIAITLINRLKEEEK